MRTALILLALLITLDGIAAEAYSSSTSSSNSFSGNSISIPDAVAFTQAQACGNGIAFAEAFCNAAGISPMGEITIKKFSQSTSISGNGQANCNPIGTTIPKITMPGVSIPKVTFPDITIPEVVIPSVIIPEIDPI